MLVGIVSTEYGSDGVAATLFYLVSYCAMTVGSFAVLAAVGPDADGVDSIQGLGKRSPLLAGCLTVFFLGLAGLPPSMAGLTSKLFVFSEALSAGLYGLAIIAVLNSALACAYYFRIPVAAFFQSAPAQQTQPISVPLTTALALVLCAAAVVLIGLFPEPLLALVRDAADSLVGP
jgi:NADH-quinone oxidoreductase subunit N